MRIGFFTLLLVSSGGVPAAVYDDRFDPNKPATPQFLAYADFVGIPHNEISQAMLVGAFNPDFDDVLRVWEELGRPNTFKIDPILRQRGIAPHDIYRKAELRQYRNPRWVERYGPLTNEQLFIHGKRTSKLFYRMRDRNYKDVKDDPYVREEIRKLRGVASVPRVLRWSLPGSLNASHNFKGRYLHQRCNFTKLMAIATGYEPPPCADETKRKKQKYNAVRTGPQSNAVLSCLVAFVDNAALGAADEALCALFSDNFDSCHRDMNREMKALRRQNRDVTDACSLLGAALTPTEMLFKEADSAMEEFPRAVKAEVFEALMTAHFQRDPNENLSMEEYQERLVKNANLGLQIGGVVGAINAIKRTRQEARE